MKLSLHNPIGATVSDAQLTELSDADVVNLKHDLAHHGVLAFRDQRIDDEQFLNFLQRLGPLVFTTGETSVPGYERQLNVVSNVGRTTPPKSNFHVDTSYVDRPPTYTALRAVTLPERGGETLFTNQYAAYDSLDAQLRERLEGRLVTHKVTGLSAEALGDSQTEAQHPLFRQHPLSGHTSVYLSTIGRCTAVSEMSDAEARDTVARLLEHSTSEANTYRHAWAPGDVVIWDNGCTLHRADHSGVVGDRVLHRGMVMGY